jgi:hypothetical protein
MLSKTRMKLSQLYITIPRGFTQEISVKHTGIFFLKVGYPLNDAHLNAI